MSDPPGRRQFVDPGSCGAVSYPSPGNCGQFGFAIFPPDEEVLLQGEEDQELHMEGGFFTTHTSQAGQGPCKMQDDAMCSQWNTIKIEQMQSFSPQAEEQEDCQGSGGSEVLRSQHNLASVTRSQHEV